MLPHTQDLVCCLALPRAAAVGAADVNEWEVEAVGLALQAIYWLRVGVGDLVREWFSSEIPARTLRDVEERLERLGERQCGA